MINNIQPQESEWIFIQKNNHIFPDSSWRSYFSSFVVFSLDSGCQHCFRPICTASSYYFLIFMDPMKNI